MIRTVSIVVLSVLLLGNTECAEGQLVERPEIETLGASTLKQDIINRIYIEGYVPDVTVVQANNNTVCEATRIVANRTPVTGTTTAHAIVWSNNCPQ